MKRRRFLAGLGGLGAAGTAVVGSGAFTAATAERSVSVTVADETDAYLSLVEGPEPNGVFADNLGSGMQGELFLDFNSNPGVSGDGTGLAKESVYEFDHVFEITNQGTQEVELSAAFDDDSHEMDLAFYAGGATGDPPALDATLGVGDTAEIGVYIATNDAAVSDHQFTATLSADATSSGTLSTDET